MRCGSTEPAKTHISSKLLFGPEIETPFGLITDATLALRRDMWERKILAQVASQAFSPLVTFTDGPIELYAGRVQEGTELSEYQKNLGDYLQELNKLCEMGVITAGYIDKPRSALVVRLLELLMLSEEELEEKPRPRPLNGVRDIYLIEQFLEAGERSAVFALQSVSTRTYTGSLALHFFYINIGRPGHPILARVEIPAWVAEEPEMLNILHASIVHQCGIMGAQPYPYLLHRAHEVARVTQQENEQVSQMVAQELVRRGINPRGKSAKQFAKDGWRKQ